MYLTALATYIPSERVPNSYFEPVNGITADWIEARTGILTRSKAADNENTHTMGAEATQALLSRLPFPAEDIDLIVGGTYTPYDTVATLAHHVQGVLGRDHIPAVSISSACSTFLNAVEIVEGYFAMNKASTALVVVSEHNSLYANETDPQSGHLWGDGAAAMVFTKAPPAGKRLNMIDLSTGGAAGVGKGLEAVVLRPRHGGINMPHGRDVFMNACQYMAEETKKMLASNDFDLHDLTYFVPHQANFRISKNVAAQLDFPLERVLSNIQRYGNTGCAGAAIALSEHFHEFQEHDLIAVAVFGGGYSYGTMLLKTEV